MQNSTASWLADEPRDLHFTFGQAVAYRENRAEYLKPPIVEVHSVSVSCSHRDRDLEHGLYTKMLPDGRKDTNMMIAEAKAYNLLSMATPLFRRNLSPFGVQARSSPMSHHKDHQFPFPQIHGGKKIFSAVLHNTCGSAVHIQTES